MASVRGGSSFAASPDSGLINYGCEGDSLGYPSLVRDALYDKSKLQRLISPYGKQRFEVKRTNELLDSVSVIAAMRCELDCLLPPRTIESP